ncbi:SGNH/GDSL hydrolase family protein [Actinoplanes sp. NBRC 103695]|uniref:SGNH/GDSL hydrolase family protein n=1 Tax=Actinoplanes sp. NBRC 103695 TaxID=3032202 RepID=UPI0024A1F39F|nr:SGNH/GDSL hydrolase family protein [Actinoplanes sp. NBRC 103695]GLY93033.1 hypothetical protein Acsp02_02890 [Actinoplanes sp. NBRC 103695]
MTSRTLRVVLAALTAASVTAAAGGCTSVLPGEQPAAAATIPAATVSAATIPAATVSAATVPAVADVRTPVRILPLGDSITYGLGSERLGSYRVELARRLASAGIAVDLVGSHASGPRGADQDNEGHSGWRIDQIAERAPGWIAAYQPDVVLLHIGTNDMRSDEKAAGAPVRLGALIDQLLIASPDVRILVAKIVGAKDTRVGGVYQQRIDAYNASVPAVVASRGARVRLVDQTGVDGTDLLDMLHPNEFGYSKMAWNWYRALQPVLRRGEPAWPMADNPFRATRKYLRSAGDVGRWWHLRTFTVRKAGKPVQVRGWQTRRTFVERYRVEASGRSVVRTRAVTRWSSA